MAYPTSVGVTAGVGTGIAFDLVGAVNFQVVKLDVGATGVAALLGAANPLPATVYETLSATQGLSWAKIDSAAGGNLDIVAGSGVQVCKLYAIFFTLASPTTVQIADTTPTTVTGAMTFGFGGGLALDIQRGPNGIEPYMVSAAGKGIRLVMGAAVQISGLLAYKQA